MIPEVEVHRTTNANESDRLSIKKTGDAASQLLEKRSTDDPKQIKVLKLHSTCYGRQSIAARNECFNDWPVRVFCQFRDRCLHPMVKQGKTLLLQRTL